SPERASASPVTARTSLWTATPHLKAARKIAGQTLSCTPTRASKLGRRSRLHLYALASYLTKPNCLGKGIHGRVAHNPERNLAHYQAGPGHGGMDHCGAGLVPHYALGADQHIRF